MPTISLLVPAEISKKGTRFGFNAKNENHFNRKVVCQSLYQKLIQDMAIGEMESYVRQFEMIPVNGTLKVSATKGNFQSVGNLVAIEEGTRQNSEAIVKKLEELGKRFAFNCPNSSFSLEFVQTITLKNIVK